jgi:glucose dehydrogenase
MTVPFIQSKFLTVFAVALAACAGSDSRSINDAALSDTSRGENWLAFGRTLNEQRFSPLQQVDTSNVKDLKVDWFLDLPDKGGLVSTPLVSNGADAVHAADEIQHAV